VKEAIVKNCALYLAAIGGAGALIAKCVHSAELIAYPELGAEAVYKLEVKDMPLVAAIDCRGKDLYENRG
ncbi:MAG: fumarate hydratase C-terminal domain-containing protein, partial [Firmicutes bacterium]|nr:fumarate hydratase C-terminal domain-containing protein [Bacillota bacterium]